MRTYRYFPFGGRQVPIWAGELTFLRLMAWRAANADGSDMAELNLLSAVELPGAEGLEVSDYLAVLHEWADVVERVTDRNYYRFQRDPAEYDHSEPYWRMLILTGVLQQHFGIKYNHAKIAEMD